MRPRRMIDCVHLFLLFSFHFISDIFAHTPTCSFYDSALLPIFGAFHASELPFVFDVRASRTCTIDPLEEARRALVRSSIARSGAAPTTVFVDSNGPVLDLYAAARGAARQRCVAPHRCSRSVCARLGADVDARRRNRHVAAGARGRRRARRAQRLARHRLSRVVLSAVELSKVNEPRASRVHTTIERMICALVSLLAAAIVSAKEPDARSSMLILKLPRCVCVCSATCFWRQR